MHPSDHACFVFEPATLLPAEWLAAAAAGPVRTFNPGLIRDGAGWIMAYRVVLADGRRRLALCRLDAARRVIAGSPRPLSDQVRFPATSPYPEVVRHWLADPRLYRWGDRMFVYWNSGWHEPQNHQFLQELDPATLAPIGPPRELVLRSGARRPLEKNWTCFADRAGALHAVYSVAPHRILRFALEGTGDLVFDEATDTAWTFSAYPTCHGGLRGGAPPFWHDGCFWSFCHTVHDGANGYCYEAAVYAFSVGPAFAPIAEPLHPLVLGRPQRSQRAHARLNPAVDEVIYPCGAVYDGTHWVISHGINDEQCAISLVSHSQVRSCVQPHRTSP